VDTDYLMKRIKKQFELAIHSQLSTKNNLKMRPQMI